jgi:hypothetical protein
MMSEEADNVSVTSIKRTYSKPELTRVLLRPEEAILGGCKFGSTAGPLGTCSITGSSCSTLSTS